MLTFVSSSLRRLSARSFAALGLLVVLVAGGIWWFASGSAPDQGKSQAPPMVTAAAVTRVDLPNEVSLVGSVVAYETVAVKSRLDSQIASVKFHDGDAVQMGDVLFQLDDRALRAQVAQAQAGTRRDDAQAATAKAIYDRNVILSQKGFVSKEALDQFRTAWQAAAATAAASAAAAKAMQVQLDYTTIRAPISGFAGTINVTQGNWVKANDVGPLVTINQVRPIRVQVAVPQRYYEEIVRAMKKDVPVQARRTEGNLAFVQGKLEYIDNAIDNANGTFAARAVFANGDAALWPGMFVDVRISLSSDHGALALPLVALQHEGEQTFVFVIDKKTMRAHRRQVQVIRTAGDIAGIASGLADGDLVITDGLLRVTDGDVVRLAPGKETAAPR
jgi:multidrug efflux system membrane fusion protein